MIGDKIFPSFYMLELEGVAANLEFLLGKDFGIERVVIGSTDFQTDMHAIVAGQAAVDFFLTNPDINTDEISDSIHLNPEFFPGSPKVEMTPEKKAQLEEMQDAIDDIAEQNGKVALVVTRNFDELGDFVSVRGEVAGDNFKMTMKVAINPHLYMVEKSHEKEYADARIINPHREAEPQIFIH